MSIFAPSSGLTLPDNAFGKDVANLGLYRALAEHGDFERLDFLNAEALSQLQLQKALLPNGGDIHLKSTHLLDFYAPCLSGILLRGQPYLSELAWMRGAFRSHHSYSLVGLIHTLAPPVVREHLGEVTLAPVQSWDALVCTSPSVKKALEEMLDNWEQHLQNRLGASRFVRPQLPLIPLGVDLERQAELAEDSKARAQLRQELGLGSEDVLVLWVGRLSFFEKAFPQPMFLALQKACEQSDVRVHFVMAGWFPNGEKDYRLYKEAASCYCPSVPVSFLNGRNQDLLGRCWAAADIFFSLVDNTQETFGLSPIEAMASGLPVVVSDWDGYRFTVREGLDGFRIPTMIAASTGIGDELSARHTLGILSYQDYVGAVAQHTAVDINAAALALERLIDNPELRKNMGNSGRQNVKERFDWPVIISQYRQLFNELSDHRRNQSFEENRGLNPLRSNPFADFANFATTQLKPERILSLAIDPILVDQSLDGLVALDTRYKGCHAEMSELHLLLVELAKKGSCSLAELLEPFSEDRYEALAMGVNWMAKMGLVQWSNWDEDNND